jgi:3-deoxy-D-manno-octulosonic-acid transferase
MRILYNFFIRLFGFSVLLATPFNSKARQWHNGRKGLLKRIKKEVNKKEKIIWFHCASLGEFEQGRPVIEAIKSTFSDHKILLTFFSPSGYEVRKNYSGADYVYYLPLDTPKNAKQFIRRTNPRMVFFIKYEFWFNFINELNMNKIPVFVVSTIFRKSQYFFKPGAGWIRKQLQKITYFFVQNEKSLALLRMVKVNHADISGDTRFDRVVALAGEQVVFPEIEQFRNNSKLLVAGSTWPADEDVLKDLISTSQHDFKLIIAPHIVSKEHIDQLSKKFSDFNPVCFSKAKPGNVKTSRVMIIDSIGKLAYIFRYASLAYIGGGFGVGIHNTLEAATYGMPVFFGPNYKKFKEAVEMNELGCAFAISNSNELLVSFEAVFSNEKKYSQTCSIAKNYVAEHAGATQKVIEKAKEYLVVP